MSQALASADRRGRLLLLMAAMMVVALVAGAGIRTMANAQEGTSQVTIVKVGLLGEDTATFSHNFHGDEATFELSAAGNSQVFSNLAAGTYSVTELPLEGYVLTGAGCSIDDAPSLQATPMAQGNTIGITVAEGQSITCTFVNGSTQVLQHTVSVTKHVDGALATEGSFDFTATWMADNLNEGVETSADFVLDSSNAYTATTAAMDAGASYSVVENGIDATCDEGDAYRLLGYGIGETLEAAAAAEPVPTAAFAALQASQHVVVMNESCATADQYTVTVTKYVEGALATEGSFDFTATWTAANLNGGLEATGDFTLDESNSYAATTSAMDAGASYSLVENGIDLVCEGDDEYRLLGYGIGETLEAAAAAEPVEAAAITDLQADQYVVVHNEPCPVGTSSITIVKEGLTDGVEAVFTHDVPADSDTFTLTAEDNSFTIEALEAGTYTFTELPIEGWRLVSAGCEFRNLSPDTAGDSLTVVLGEDEHQTCTFVNEMEPSSVTIEKFVDGATAVDGSFEFTQTTTAAESVVTLDTSNSFVQTTDDIPGGTAYMLSENGIDAVCEEGDEYRLAGYTMGANREEALAGEPMTEVNIEALMGDVYVIVWNQDCDNLGTITIVKNFNPDADATASFTAEGLGTEDFTIAEGEENGMTFENLGVGDYTFTEEFLAGWRVQSIFCSGQQSPSNILINLGAASVTVSLTAGDDITCTFTNIEDADTVPGSLTIVKDWGEDTGVDTTFTVSENLGVEGNAITLMDSEGADRMAFEGIAPATYTFVEGELEGWTLTGILCEGQDSPESIDIDLTARSLGVNLQPGETVVCTFTNSMDDVTPVETGSITINKVANPNLAVTFSFTATGEGLSPFVLATGGEAASATTSFPGLAPGSYTVTETDLEGWTVTNIVCEGAGEGSANGDVNTRTTTIELVAGADVECTYTNTQDELLALLDSVPFLDQGTPVTNETPNVNVPNIPNTGTDTTTDNVSNVGGELPTDNTGNVPSTNNPNPGLGGSTDPFLNPGQQPAQQDSGQGSTQNPSSVLGEQTPLAPSTGTGLAAGDNDYRTVFAMVVALVLGSSALAIRAASRR